MRRRTWDYIANPDLPWQTNRPTYFVLAFDLTAEPADVQAAVMNTMKLARRHYYDLGPALTRELLASCQADGIQIGETLR